MTRKNVPLLVVLLCLSISGCGKSKQEKIIAIENQRAEPASQPQRVERAVDSENIKSKNSVETARLQEKIANMVKDPDSVKFRKLQFNDDKVALCGEINAKNAFGGYVGYRRFIASNNESVIEGERKADHTEDLMSRIPYKSAAIKAGCPTDDE